RQPHAAGCQTPVPGGRAPAIESAVQAAHFREDVRFLVRRLACEVHQAAHGLADVGEPVLLDHLLEKAELRARELDRDRRDILHPESSSIHLTAGCRPHPIYLRLSLLARSQAAARPDRSPALRRPTTVPPSSPRPPASAPRRPCRPTDRRPSRDVRPWS